MPRAMLSSVSIAMYDAISRAASWSRRRRRKYLRQPMSLVGGRFHQARDRARQLLPSRGLGGEHLLAGRSQTVVLRFAIVLRGAPERGHQAAVLEPVQRRIQRPVF